MRRFARAGLLLCLSACAASGASDAADPLSVKFGGFIDAYYAYDALRPPNRDRSFATQPARHNEFNANLAFIEAVVSGERVRGRLALQAGNSVQANYAGEPRVGTVGGPDLGRHVQEAVVGYRATPRLWVDAGVFFSHIGLESWVSRDNWTYTRSLMADYSPYYQAGVKAGYQVNDSWSAQLHVLNGWQNISENNENKALGGQLAWTGPDGWSAAYNNFWGQEVGNQGRFFNDLVIKTPEFGRLRLAAAFDYGLQKRPSGMRGFSQWHAGALLARWRFSKRVAAAARVERLVDRGQVVVVTGLPASFRGTGASANVDVALHEQLLWRTEFRQLWCEEAVYPKRPGGSFSRSDGVVVTSLALTF
ncbi:MAG: porin [Elusimicrobia bacterium]|nr:porin [Elusimicrobiota bacterium]